MLTLAHTHSPALILGVLGAGLLVVGLVFGLTQLCIWLLDRREERRDTAQQTDPPAE